VCEREDVLHPSPVSENVECVFLHAHVHDNTTCCETCCFYIWCSPSSLSHTHSLCLHAHMCDNPKSCSTHCLDIHRGAPCLCIDSSKSCEMCCLYMHTCTTRQRVEMRIVSTSSLSPTHSLSLHTHMCNNTNVVILVVSTCIVVLVLSPSRQQSIVTFVVVTYTCVRQHKVLSYTLSLHPLWCPFSLHPDKIKRCDIHCLYMHTCATTQSVGTLVVSTFSGTPMHTCMTTQRVVILLVSASWFEFV